MKLNIGVSMFLINKNDILTRHKLLPRQLNSLGKIAKKHRNWAVTHVLSINGSELFVLTWTENLKTKGLEEYSKVTGTELH